MIRVQHTIRLRYPVLMKLRGRRFHKCQKCAKVSENFAYTRLTAAHVLATKRALHQVSMRVGRHRTDI